jgi:hypothetical protein
VPDARSWRARENDRQLRCFGSAGSIPVRLTTLSFAFSPSAKYLKTDAAAAVRLRALAVASIVDNLSFEFQPQAEAHDEHITRIDVTVTSFVSGQHERPIANAGSSTN